VSTTFDSDTITFDSDVVTWDAGFDSGFVLFRFASGASVVVPLATVRTQSFTYDRQMFRSPYGTVWHQEGDARRLAEEVEVSVHVIDDPNGISDAALTATAVIADAVAATRISSVIGEVVVAGLLGYTRQPIESGYRLDFRFASVDGLRT
jgi:hypothetical protein